jgi:hypothetical protein
MGPILIWPGVSSSLGSATREAYAGTSNAQGAESAGQHKRSGTLHRWGGVAELPMAAVSGRLADWGPPIGPPRRGAPPAVFSAAFETRTHRPAHSESSRLALEADPIPALVSNENHVARKTSDVAG